MDYAGDDPVVRRAWGDQASARIRDVAKELIRAARLADVPVIAADWRLDKEGHVRVVYITEEDELWLVFPNSERESVLLSIERLGIRR